MTDTDFLEQRRAQINDRIAELEPSVVEYGRLNAAVEALAGIPAPKNGGSVSVPARRRRGRLRRSESPTAACGARNAKTPKVGAPAKTGRRPTGRPKGSGKRAVEALTHIEARPGITTTELAKTLGIKPTYLYRVLPALQKEGKIRREGRGWHFKQTATASA